MSTDKKRMYEGKREWAARRMAENAEIETLNADQHDALAMLCEIRHQVHCNQDDLWTTGSSNFKAWWDIVGTDSETEESLKYIFKECGLPFPPLLDSGLPNDEWYYDLSDEERTDWETRAENEGYNWGDGFTAWREKSWEYEQFQNEVNDWNHAVEEYLGRIDELHGTNYRPSGVTRLY